MWVHPAIQIARHLGAHVVTTAAPRRDAWLTGLGAEQVIDYTDLDFVEVLRDDPVDVVLDLVGGAVGPRSAGVLRAGGLLVELPEGIDGPTRAAAKAASVRVVTHAVTLDRPRLTEIASPAAAGVLTAHLCEVRPLSEAADAHRTIEAGHVTGKLVLQPWRTRVRHRPSARRATHDRVAHVTGDSGGIGRPTARRLAADGLAVVVHYTGNPDSAEETVAAITADGGIATALGRRCRRRGGDFRAHQGDGESAGSTWWCTRPGS